MSLHPPTVPEIEVRSAYEKAQAGEGLILDVREHEELQQVSVRGAVNIPLGVLVTRFGELPGDQQIYVLCHSGQRSAMATEYLRGAGYERVWNVRGGILAWIRDRLPVDWSSG